MKLEIVLLSDTMFCCSNRARAKAELGLRAGPRTWGQCSRKSDIEKKTWIKFSVIFLEFELWNWHSYKDTMSHIWIEIANVTGWKKIVETYIIDIWTCLLPIRINHCVVLMHTSYCCVYSSPISQDNNISSHPHRRHQQRPHKKTRQIDVSNS